MEHPDRVHVVAKLEKLDLHEVALVALVQDRLRPEARTDRDVGAVRQIEREQALLGRADEAAEARHLIG
jgi:hypothetical protein